MRRLFSNGIALAAIAVFSLMLSISLYTQAAAFQPLKGNMSGFIPGKSDTPVTGDTIKIGLINPFSGAAAKAGELFYISTAWVAHDINSQGGIMVDGKMKKVQIVKGDTQVKPEVARKVIEKLILEDKVDVLVGTSGTHIALIAQMMAGQHKKIFINNCAYSDLLLDDKNFNPYVFQVLAPNTTQWTMALAQYFAKRPEKKFYILCQDYAYGHSYAQGFKAALKKFRPDAKIVGEDYFPLFLKDFAPYLTKIKASGADMIITQAWSSDNENLLKQSRQFGLKTPVISLYLDEPNQSLKALGPQGAGMIVMQTHIPAVNTPLNNKFNELWNRQWKKWSKPYDTDVYKWPENFIGSSVNSLYWFFDVMQRAGTTNSDKIVKTWEGDKYNSLVGQLYMRPQDHLFLGDIFFSELVHPNKWFSDNASWGQVVTIPRAQCTPPVINGRK